MHWAVKAALQAFIAKVPYGEDINYRLQVLNGSYKQDRPGSYARLDNYIDVANSMALLLQKNGMEISGARLVEAGTGWQPFMPIYFALLGASRVYTYDHVAHARLERAMIVLDRLDERAPDIAGTLGIPLDGLKRRRAGADAANGMRGLFDSLGIVYKAPGDAGQTGLDDNSADLFFTHAVLEHMPTEVVVNVTREACRTLRPGGFYYNVIGLHDHYVTFDRKITKVNFLKYSGAAWSALAQNKISYLNRLRYPDYVRIIKDAGFEIVDAVTEVNGPSLAAIKAGMKLDASFKAYAPEELAITRAEVLARKR
ncbi:MAG: class I SAM-dependent methyltransferase [Deltaproteobacteria bacterium]|nr:class I SAM-dependent methyltransferase [Deltaproteobacteria bacterium]